MGYNLKCKLTDQPNVNSVADNGLYNYAENYAAFAPVDALLVNSLS